MRRLSTGALGAVLLGFALLLVASPAASARGAAMADDVPPGRAGVVKVSGLLDPVLVDFVSQAIEEAEAQDALSVTLQLNSAGAVVSDAEIDALTEQMRASDVPVAVWVGPSGSKALDEAARLVEAAADSGMAPGTRQTSRSDAAISSSVPPR